MIYDSVVVHRRHDPEHVVRRRLRLAYLDPDDPPRGWRRSDHLDGGDAPLVPAVADLVEARTGERPGGPVRVLTQLRSLGWLFNPLTTYYCFDADGTTLAAVVLEVSNTPWHERHWYVTRPGTTTFPKAFHVSPFLPIDLTYRCTAEAPGDRLALRLDVRRGDEPVLDVALTGRPTTARPRPLQTIGVSAGIYAHAAALRRKGARFHPHPERTP